MDGAAYRRSPGRGGSAAGAGTLAEFHFIRSWSGGRSAPVGEGRAVAPSVGLRLAGRTGVRLPLVQPLPGGCRCCRLVCETGVLGEGI